ncbi:hypothetical protein HWV62_3925 [Athelia sp. TMB]|nr:hypothetical protein HWV62_3925 [Athelia sp. TMB]
MRFSAASLLAVLAVTSSSLAAVVTRTTSTPQSINPDLSVLQSVASRNLHARAPAPAPMTNAQRMARGLPPKAPTRRTNLPRQPRPSSTPPRSITGYINVSFPADASEPSGYFTNSQNAFGEYESRSTDVTQALKVALSYSPANPSQLEITTVNGPATQAANTPFLGAIQGYASGIDIGPGSANYLYLGSVPHSAAGSSPIGGDNSFSTLTGISEAIESSFWKLDTTSGALTCEWINSDGTAPPCIPIFTQNQFAITGDLAAFQDTFGPAQEINFTFIPSA